MIQHRSITDRELLRMIRGYTIRFGGNASLKIYGTLHCRSGKRMKKMNRVFFRSETEAIRLGYRPCAHCMRAAYQQWKLSKKQVE
jgi:methylphosphotriester-DNA--protein-cysteine methyltransferase